MFFFTCWYRYYTVSLYLNIWPLILMVFAVLHPLVGNLKSEASMNIHTDPEWNEHGHHLFTLLAFSLALSHCSGTYYFNLSLSLVWEQHWSEIRPDERHCGLICWSMWEKEDFLRSWENELREGEYWLVLLMRGFLLVRLGMYLILSLESNMSSYWKRWKGLTSL